MWVKWIASSILCLAALWLLQSLAGEFMFFWYATVRSIVWLSGRWLPLTLLGLSAVSVGGYLIGRRCVSVGRGRGRSAIAIWVAAGAALAVATIYVSVWSWRGADLSTLRALVATGSVAATVGLWAIVSIAFWEASLWLVRHLTK